MRGSGGRRAPPDAADKLVEVEWYPGGADRRPEKEGTPPPPPPPPPKLEEGYYLVEDIRKKRVHKGNLQYLVKWHGYPESANTWEPPDNLKSSCPDFIEAFEERSSRKRNRSRNRKRSYDGSHSMPNKKKRPARAPAPWEPLAAPGQIPYDDTDGQQQEKEDEEEEDEKENEKEGDEKGSELEDDKKQLTEPAQANEDNPKVGTDQTEHISVILPCAPLEEEGSITMDGYSKAPSSDAVASHFRGAKKRKSGSVTRFKQDPPPPSLCQHQGDHRAAASSCRVETPATDDADSTQDQTGDNNTKPDNSTDPHTITKIIRPIRYFASVTDNVQQVAITFKALRSDGKEVLVDDKHLKANNPLLLIGYYEQHIRCSPHS